LNGPNPAQVYAHAEAGTMQVSVHMQPGNVTNGGIAGTAIFSDKIMVDDPSLADGAAVPVTMTMSISGRRTERVARSTDHPLFSARLSDERDYAGRALPVGLVGG
jgi:hypothetical protein